MATIHNPQTPLCDWAPAAGLCALGVEGQGAGGARTGSQRASTVAASAGSHPACLGIWPVERSHLEYSAQKMTKSTMHPRFLQLYSFFIPFISE